MPLFLSPESSLWLHTLTGAGVNGYFLRVGHDLQAYTGVAVTTLSNSTHVNGITNDGIHMARKLVDEF